MAAWLRILLWAVVLVVPGGLLLLPVLVGDAVVRHKRLTQCEPNALRAA